MRLVQILRGLPGSGKTRYRNQQMNRALPNLLKVWFCSADDFYETSEGWKFDPKLLPQAHKECLIKYLRMLQTLQEGLIIVDNTNISAWEISPYAQLALAHDWSFEILYFPCTLEIAKKRNIHAVPDNTLLAMSTRLQTEILPNYWKVIINNGNIV